MKKYLSLFILSFVTCTLGAFAQIKVNSSGYVGINNASPAYRLDVSGAVRFSDGSSSILISGGNLYPLSSASLGNYGSMWTSIFAQNAYFSYSPVILSDSKYKTNVKDLSSMGDKLKLLRPVTYTLNISKEITTAEPRIQESPAQYGLIAQELQEVFPEIVAAQEDGTLGVRYMELIPVLIKAYQEQQAELEALKERISKLEKK
jgi:hypothetical protein